MMHYNANIFGYQYVVVLDFLQHVAYYRSIKAELNKQDIKSNFWAKTCNAHLEAGILDWCKVFGSEGPNRTHWKKTAGQTPDAAQDEFRQQVLIKTGFTSRDWVNYHKEMCTFRDRYVAHLDFDKIPPVPFLDKALQVAFAYDAWIRKQIEPDIIDDPRLEQLYDNWLAESSQFVGAATQHREADN
jgi:hypothetical protein